jgi:hypothetical protein
MRILGSLFLLLILSACGNDGGSGSKSKQADNGCNLNGSVVPCQSIRGADGLGVDLLETMIDVPAKVQDTEVTFLADKSSMATGRRITCKTVVKNGEVYRIAVRGDSLLVITGEGSYEMSRLNGEGGHHGTWVWKGYVEEGTHIIRQLTFIGNSRVILRTTCEL